MKKIMNICSMNLNTIEPYSGNNIRYSDVQTHTHMKIETINYSLNKLCKII